MEQRSMLASAAVAICMLGVAPRVSADELVVRYSEGSVELQQRGAWTSLQPGDTVSPDATLRVGEGGYAEISDGSTTLRLAQSGTFHMSNLLGGRSAPARRTVTSMLRSRVERFYQPRPPSDPTVGGTRSIEYTDEPGLDWVGGESVPELIEAGREALAAGDIDEAFGFFDEAALYATESERPEAAFYLGYTLFLSGEVRGALSRLREYAPDPDTDYYHEHVMALAQTQLELSLTHDTIALLSAYTEGQDLDYAKPEAELLPTAHLLLGLGHRINGDRGAARRELERVGALAPGSADAAVAAEVLRDL